MADQVGNSEHPGTGDHSLPSYASLVSTEEPLQHHHTNVVIEAAQVRSKDEQEMQNMLQSVQLASRVFNSEIDPEHDTDRYCECPVHKYERKTGDRLPVQTMWSNAVMYPGETAYHNCYQRHFFAKNPYLSGVISPYMRKCSTFSDMQRPDPDCHAKFIEQTVELNMSLNAEAQATILAQESALGIWDTREPESLYSGDPVGNQSSSPDLNSDHRKKSGSRGIFKWVSGGSAASKAKKRMADAEELRRAILEEESARWPNQEFREIVDIYKEKVGITQKVADLREHHPIQYLHLLRGGFFEPIPKQWADNASSPLNFTVDAAAGWRGITPAWRGYENTAEERLYWVLNHRDGVPKAIIKPDMISVLKMARARMASAIEPPPGYSSPGDICQQQFPSEGYSRQVMPAPFRAFDSQSPMDDTMILLDVSGSMETDPIRPIYNQYLITGYSKSNQPKNMDVAKAITRRFTDAMANHDHSRQSYQLVTFSSQAKYVGPINHWNFEEIWNSIQFGGRTRVMTGWQRVKELHFQKHPSFAKYHPVYGWQAGPDMPLLRLLLLLDGEARDMDEFELDLLGLSWAHITIFLIGVDGCPHHHRHANELQRISDVNPHVSFVDAQGNAPERFITHELLKRHLGQDLSLSAFEELEQPPEYSEVNGHV